MKSNSLPFILPPCSSGILEKVWRPGGEGDLIAMHKDGNIINPFNSFEMCMAYIDTRGKMAMEIFKD